MVLLSKKYESCCLELIKILQQIEENHTQHGTGRNWTNISNQDLLEPWACLTRPGHSKHGTVLDLVVTWTWWCSQSWNLVFLHGGRSVKENCWAPEFVIFQRPCLISIGIASILPSRYLTKIIHEKCRSECRVLFPTGTKIRNSCIKRQKKDYFYIPLKICTKWLNEKYALCRCKSKWL